MRSAMCDPPQREFVSSSPAWLMSERASLAPREAIFWAVARPMPEAEPVMRQTLSSKRYAMVRCRGGRIQLTREVFTYCTCCDRTSLEERRSRSGECSAEIGQVDRDAVLYQHTTVLTRLIRARRCRSPRSWIPSR